MIAENKIGFDDYLVKVGAEAFRELVKNAKPTLELHVEERTSTDLILTELTRLNDDITRAKMFRLIGSREKVKTEAVIAEYQKHIVRKEGGSPFILFPYSQGSCAFRWRSFP